MKSHKITKGLVARGVYYGLLVAAAAFVLAVYIGMLYAFPLFVGSLSVVLLAFVAGLWADAHRHEP